MDPIIEAAFLDELQKISMSMPPPPMAQGPHPKHPDNAPHREMGAAQRKVPYKPQIVQQKDPFAP